jgi:hypothetical protein
MKQTAICTEAKCAKGVELSSSRFLGAQEALMRAQKIDPKLASRVTFLNEDLMQADLNDATVIYTCSTAFSIVFFRKVVATLATMKHPFKLVSLQELPSSRYFRHLDTLHLDMSWSRKTAVNIYQRK